MHHFLLNFYLENLHLTVGFMCVLSVLMKTVNILLKNRIIVQS